MKKLFLLMMMIIATSTVVYGADLKKIKEQMETTFPWIVADEIKELAPKSTLYEIQTGNRIIYFDTGTNYLIVGNLVNQQGKNLTQERLTELASQILKDTLPRYEMMAVRGKAGNGEPIYVITDPDCPFCNKVMEHLIKKPNPVYLFFYPLESIHPDAKKKSLYMIERLKEKKTTYYDVKQVADKNPKSLYFSADAEFLLKNHIEFALKIGVDGVPVIIYKGQRINGANIPAIDELIK